MASDAEKQALRARAGRVSLAAGLLVFGGKVSAYILTGSAAVFSDAMESTVNVVAAGLLVWTLSIAARPADRGHPYGHGKVEFFSAGIEGALIVVAAVLIAVEAIREIVSGEGPERLGIGLALLAGFSTINLALGLYLVRSGRQTGSLALVADGKHVLTDVWTSAGVIIGLAAVAVTGFVLLDPLIAMLVAANVVREGWKLTRTAVEGLMDAADDELLGGITAELELKRPPEWIDVHGLRAWRSGAALHTDLHLVVPRYFDADQLHSIHEAVEDAITLQHVGPGEAVVHFDPCRAPHCSSCAMSDCPVRSTALMNRPSLTLARATREDGQAEAEVRAAAR
jgi:cation diffusion facilitator family transporter